MFSRTISPRWGVRLRPSGYAETDRSFDSRFYIGESPSGKAGAFEAPIPWFESMLPSHPSPMHLYLSSYRLGDKVEQLQEWFKRNPTVGYIPNACDFTKADPIKKKEHDEWNINALEQIGLKVQVLDLRDYFGKKDELRDALARLGGVWISGGNVFVLLQAMKLSGFDDLLINEFSKDPDFVYGGYSAAGCVLSPTMRCYSVVDDATDHPYAGWSETIWDGLGLIDFAFMPHFDSDHSESADINKEVAYCEEHGIPYKTLRDGEVILI